MSLMFLNKQYVTVHSLQSALYLILDQNKFNKNIKL